MRHTASHFMKLDSCQQQLCSLDPLYAKYIQYLVWKQCCFRIQLLTPSSVLLTTSLCPHNLLCSGWLRSWTFSLSLCFFFFFYNLSVIFISLSFFCRSLFSVPAHFSLGISPAPPPDNSPSVWVPSTMVHLWGLHPLQGTVERVHTWCVFGKFSLASLKQQTNAANCAKFLLPLSGFLHLNHTLSCLKDYVVGCIIGLHSVLLDRVPFRNPKKTTLSKLRSGRVAILQYCQTWHEKSNHIIMQAFRKLSW